MQYILGVHSQHCQWATGSSLFWSAACGCHHCLQEETRMAALDICREQGEPHDLGNVHIKSESVPKAMAIQTLVGLAVQAHR